MQPEIVCKNCGNNYTGKYCNKCGEKLYTISDRSVKHVIEEGFHFFTHFEGTFFTTVKTMFRSPGKFAEDYCNGIRKKYFKPISLFLLLIILYLIFPVFEGLNMRLVYHEDNAMYGNYAKKKILEVMLQKHISFETLSENFHHISEKISKFLLLIIIPLAATVSRVIGYRKRKLYFDHFIFTAEAASFFLLWGFLLTPILFLAVAKITKWQPTSELATLVIVMLPLIVYVLIASRRFFAFKRFYAALYTLLFLGALSVATVFIYKFILFFISINLV